MAGIFSAINLSELPFPNVVEKLDYEAVFSDILSDFKSRDPEYNNITEGDPAYKILQVAAYREILIRQRVNNSAKAVMLGYAKNDDLDNLVANFNVERLMIDEGEPEAFPPIPATYESDDELRRRALLAWEAQNTAGASGSYLFFALSADPDVKDASTRGPELTEQDGDLVSTNGILPGQVLVSILSRTGNGAAPTETLSAVQGTLNKDDIRPLTDYVTVQSAEVREYTIEAELTLYPGPDGNVVRQAAIDTTQKYVDENHKLGRDITLSGIYSALHQPGVQNVRLVSPTNNIINDETQASFCTSINVQVVGRDE